jgi:hypothetical protein
MHKGRIEFDGPTEGAIARHHELLAAEEDQGGSSSAVRVLHRELCDLSGDPVRTVHQDEDLVYRVRLRFEQPVESPQVMFRVFGEDGMGLYQAQTQVGDTWRTFEPGEETEVGVRFRPRFGGGGTYRAAVVVASIDTSVMFVNDVDGIPFFVEPRRGVVGVCDLEASIAVDDEDRTDGRSMRFHRSTAEAEGA